VIHMMHAIKFRVWDVHKKEMRLVSSVNFGDEGLALTISVEPDKKKGELYRNLVHTESGMLMHYTGLKDRAGKEIYEGDIVRTRRVGYRNNVVSWEKIEVGPVIWGSYFDGEYLSDLQCWMIDLPIYGGSPISSHVYEARDSHGEMWVEVIGNLYQNPELMKAGENSACNQI